MDKLSVDYSVTVDQKIVEVLKNTTVETENKSLFTNEFYNKEVYINIENGNIISIFSNTVKIKTIVGLNSKLINYKNIFILCRICNNEKYK